MRIVFLFPFFFFFLPYLCILPPGREIFARVQSYPTDCFGGICASEYRDRQDPHFCYVHPLHPCLHRAH